MAKSGVSKRRGTFVTLAVLTAALFAGQGGCSSTSTDSPATTAAAAPVLNGNYAWLGAGPAPNGIKQITFFQQSYSMFLDCAPGQTDGCFDYGGFKVGADGNSLTFTSAIDAKERTLPFHLGTQTSASQAGTTTAQDQRLQAGQVKPDGLVSGDAGPLTNDAGPLVYGNVPIVNTFGMDGDGGADGFCLVCALEAALLDTDAGGDDSGAQAGDTGSTNQIPGDPGYTPGPDETQYEDTGSMTGSGHSLGHGFFDDPVYGSNPNTSGDGSHVSNNSSTYDIWTHNCHNAANYALTHNQGAGQWGIISCYGNDAVKSQSGHTYNYVVNGKAVTFWNWGSSCTATDKTYTAPPDISSGDALTCVKKFCGDQYNAPGVINYLRGETTTALPPGMQVERPSVVNCTIQATQAQASAIFGQSDQSAFNSCNSCCNDYANYWMVDSKAGSGQSQAMKTSYLTHCLSHCRSVFGQN